MRRRRDHGPQAPGVVDDGRGQGRALHGVRAAAQLVQQDERLVVRLFQNADDVAHVG